MKIYGLITSLVIIIILGIFYFSQSRYEESDIVFQTNNGEIGFNVEVANTWLTRSKGLMNRESLPEDRGMLFVWEDEKKQIILDEKYFNSSRYDFRFS